MIGMNIHIKLLCLLSYVLLNKFVQVCDMRTQEACIETKTVTEFMQGQSFVFLTELPLKFLGTSYEE